MLVFICALPDKKAPPAGYAADGVEFVREETSPVSPGPRDALVSPDTNECGMSRVVSRRMVRRRRTTNGVVTQAAETHARRDQARVMPSHPFWASRDMRLLFLRVKERTSD